MATQQQARSIPNPFQPTKNRVPRPQIFLWGEAGTGKTRCSLMFGKTAYVALERGAEFYHDEFDYDEIKPSNVNEVITSLKFLATGNHDYKTVVIDPLTVLYEMIQDEYMDAKRAAKGNQSIELSAGDWRIIKPRYFKILDMIRRLDMNVFVIARVKKNYSPGGSEEMFVLNKDDPFAPNIEASTSHIFDTEIQLQIDRRGGKVRFMATVRKDRTGKFDVNQKPFEFTKDAIEQTFGQIINQAGAKVELPSDEELTTCEWCGSEIEGFGNMTPVATAKASKEYLGSALCEQCRHEHERINTETKTETEQVKEIEK